MSLTYTWKINNINKESLENGLTDVVKDIFWEYAASNERYITFVRSNTTLDAPNPDKFIPFSELTENKFIDWIKDKDKDNIEKFEQILNEQLQNCNPHN